MKKTLKIGILALLVVLVVVVVGVLSYLNTIVKTSVQEIGPRVLGVPVTLADVDIRPFQGEARIQGLKIGNPEGFKTEGLFDLDSLDVAVDLASLKTDTVIIRHILVKGPVVTYEKTMKSSNLKALMEQLESQAEPGPGEEPPPEAEPPAEEKPGKKVVIEELKINEGKVLVSLPGMMGKAATLPLPPVEMNDVGKEEGGDGEGASPVVVVRKVIGTVLSSVTSVVSGAGKLVGEGAKMVGEGAMAVGEGAVKGAEAAGKAAGEGAKAVGDAAGKGAKAVGDAAGKGAKAAGEGAKAVGDAAGKGAKAVGDAVGGGAKAVGDAGGKALNALSGGLLGGKKDAEDGTNAPAEEAR